MLPLEPQDPLEPTGEEQILENLFEDSATRGAEAADQRDRILESTSKTTEAVRDVEDAIDLGVKVAVSQLEEAKKTTEAITGNTEVLRETVQTLQKQGQDIQDGAQITIKGIKGDTGERGEKGDSIKGDKGDKGDTGERGTDGKDGEQGPKGDRGDKGESIVGPQGPVGKQGPKGAKGDKGDVGPEPDVSKFVASFQEKVEEDINKRVEVFRKLASRDYDLTELKDVSISNPTLNQVLKYNGSKWVNGSGGAGGTAWGDITGTLSDQTDLQTVLNTIPDNITDFVNQTAWRIFYSDGSGDIQELALGASGTFLKSNGAASVPSFAVPAGTGDVTKVGTPVNNQVGVWTGDGTIEGDTALTFDTTSNTLATEIVTVTDDAYGAGWNGSTAVPTKNAVYDKIESMGGGVTEAFVIAMAVAL